ncbi:MAG: hypothetical protein ABI340_04690 [Nitrososphaera sp.]|jgi:hypothetical protein
MYDSKYYIGKYADLEKQRLQLLSENSVLKNQVELMEKTVQGSNNAVQSSSIKVKIQQAQSQISENNKEIDSLFAQMNQIQQQVYKLVEVDPTIKAKLDVAMVTLYDEYINVDSKTFVAGNPVTLLYPDYEHKKIVVIFDPDKIKDANGAKMQSDITNRINELVGFWPLEVQYGKLQMISCTSRTAQCSPLEGGISDSQAGQTASQGSTMGYYSVRSTSPSDVGFVIPSHAAGSVNTLIVQPAGSSNVVGTVTINPCPSPTNTCDYAYVHANNPPGIANTVFNNGVSDFTIQNRILKSNQLVGTIIEKSGVATGITMGQIQYNPSNAPYVITTVQVATGDSGSPVFTPLANNGINLYGMMYTASGGTAGVYFPWDVVKNALGLQQ